VRVALVIERDGRSRMPMAAVVTQAGKVNFTFAGLAARRGSERCVPVRVKGRLRLTTSSFQSLSVIHIIKSKSCLEEICPC
jgi:hypothetical protein